jgi:signal transduction histidine kinase/CheY-like chemotaxis protein
MPFSTHIFNRYRHLLRQEEEIITKTRIKILMFSVIGFLCLFTTLFILFLFQEHNFLLIRAGGFVLLFAITLVLLLFKLPWTFAGHFFIICVTLLIWSNALLFHNSVNIINVQYVLLVLSGGYYILGVRAGIIYSSINILPVIVNVITSTYGSDTLAFQQVNINNQAFIITFCFNFILLLFIHYSFFRALKKSNYKEQQLRINLQKALVEAQELAVAKTNFLTTMSHELRTPLNAVVGMANILLMEKPLDRQKDHLNILKFSTENLMSTVNDILDFNKINNEKIILKKEVFSAAELIANVSGTFKASAEEKKLKFDCHIDNSIKHLIVVGDRLRLTQVLFHLISNAIKFTSEGFVSLNVAVIKRDTETVSLRFSVADSGIGIPADAQSQIFEPFTTSLSRTSRQYHGTLGLTIAYHLVKLHHSELCMQSIEGKGTTFEFELEYPVSSVLSLSNPAPKKAAVDMAGLRVLVVEDEKLNVLVIKKILSKWEIGIDVAENGQQAVDMVVSKDYDVILMDINMPIMDGFEASKRIRELDAAGKSDVPIIAVTASIGAAIEKISEYPFIDDCLLKPFNPEHLKEKLEQITGKIKAVDKGDSPANLSRFGS